MTLPRRHPKTSFHQKLSFPHGDGDISGAMCTGTASGGDKTDTGTGCTDGTSGWNPLRLSVISDDPPTWHQTLVPCLVLLKMEKRGGSFSIKPFHFCLEFRVVFCCFLCGGEGNQSREEEAFLSKIQMLGFDWLSKSQP